MRDFDDCWKGADAKGAAAARDQWMHMRAGTAELLTANGLFWGDDLLRSRAFPDC